MKKKENNKRRKRCPECKQLKPADEVYNRTCGYQEDINNDPNYWHIVCDDCEYEHLMDI